FLHMQTGDTKHLLAPVDNVSGRRALAGQNFYRTVLSQWAIILRDLISLRQIGVEVILPGKYRDRVDCAPESHGSASRHGNRVTVQNRQSSGESQAHGTRISVGRI